MDGGRTSGEGREGRGLVAGVKAAFKGRPRGSSKSRSGPLHEETPGPSAAPPSTATAGSDKSPRSPILGWRKLKHKESHKGKECPKSEEARGNERNGQCSRSQALRLSHHSLPNYTSYAFNSGLGKVVPSGQLNGRVYKEADYWIPPRALSPSWHAAKSVKFNKVEENDLNGSSQNDELSEKCVSDLGVSEAAQRGGVEGVMAGSDRCDGQPATVMISHTRGGGGAAGEGGSDAALCQSQSNKEVVNGPVFNDDAFRDGKYYDEPPLTHDREPWLRSALRYSLRVPQCPRNEVVVLALGVDQYVEEVFRFLDQSGAGRVGVEDFHGLCRILGLEDEGATTEIYKCRCLTQLGSVEDPAVSGPMNEVSCPAHISFREFRERLCEVFIRNADAHSLLSLGARRPANSPLVTSVVSVQRRYEVLGAISRKLSEVTARLKCEEERQKEESGEPVCGKCQQVIHVDRNSNISLRPRDAEVTYLQRQVLLQQQELQCLREVIDDLRVALQSSDAENLALQVQALRLAQWRQQASLQDLSLTDEENTIDNLVRQLAELDPQSISAAPGPHGEKKEEKENISPVKDVKQPPAPRERLNTAYVSGDASLESELQATYEALQAAREQQEATQADLQQTVGQLQQREADLQKVEDSLQTAQAALGQAHTDNLSLVTEMAEARNGLEESRGKLAQTLSDLQQARDIILQKEKQLEEAEARLDQLRDSNGQNPHLHTLPCLQSSRHAPPGLGQHSPSQDRSRVVTRVGAARELVAGSLGQVRAGEHALAALAAHATHVKLEDARRADSGLYSEDSERDEDTCPDRSSEHASVSEEDLWSLRGSDVSSKSQPSPPTAQTVATTWITADSTSSTDSSASSSNSGSDDGYKTEVGEASLPGNTSTSSSREIIEGLERELEWLQQTLEEAEREWQEESPEPAEDDPLLKDESVKLQGEAREDEGDRERLSLLEDQLKQLLEALISVADMNLSRRTLGRLVLEAVQDASDSPASPVRPGAEEEEPPISLLTKLLSSLSFHAPDKHRQEDTDWLFHSALRGLTRRSEARERVEVTMG
ncbi:uncharacterized protein LOC127009310 isoform X1 [Eriocheir sinensis]|uniref:uncharacterized protein LOC127009310 isoform X1 n=1 Tax=Eriocheir sinensis TaxID=95602 RepID=UPI0021C9C6F2|nr:uncharacterized protein LOC127009310 isoform X1 [Eriocheir sinensis]